MNFNRFILTWLPHTLRRETLFSFIAVLLSPVNYLYNLFILFKNEKIIDQAGTNQVIYLIKLAKDKLALNIDIIEDTGLPNDFIVKCETLDTDRQRKLVALINRYKQAGKSFTINNAAITFEQTWGGYVCELQTVIQTWGAYVCEKSQLVENTIHVELVSGSNEVGTIDVTASVTPVSVGLVVFIIDDDNNNSRNAIITHERTTSDPTPQMIEYLIPLSTGERITDITLLNEEDETYNFILEKIL